jgi:hypothetical protein
MGVSQDQAHKGLAASRHEPFVGLQNSNNPLINRDQIPPDLPSPAEYQRAEHRRQGMVYHLP